MNDPRADAHRRSTYIALSGANPALLPLAYGGGGGGGGCLSFILSIILFGVLGCIALLVVGVPLFYIIGRLIGTIP